MVYGQCQGFINYSKVRYCKKQDGGGGGGVGYIDQHSEIEKSHSMEFIDISLLLVSFWFWNVSHSFAVGRINFKYAIDA